MSKKPRFYNVLRGIGPNGAARRLRYLEYLQGLTEEQPAPTTIGTREARKSVYVTPFAFGLAADTVETESCLVAAYGELRGTAGLTQHVTDALGSNTPVAIKSYKAPRISRKILAGVRQGTSKFTGARYAVRGGSALSLPFGRRIQADTPQTVYASAAAALEAANPNARCTFIDEVS